MEKKPQKTPKEKRRNMERRKEKSRDAARCRRSKEHEIFTDLYSALPISKTDGVSHLDKASIIRIAVSYLKIRAIIKSMPFAIDENKLSMKSDGADSSFLDALEGFLLVTTKDGDIVFISQNVNRYLGLSQVDVLGQSIYELSHPCDHAELKEMLSTKERSTRKSYFLRMKNTLTNKGRNVNIKSASYKVIRYTGRMVECDSKFLPDEIKREHTDENEPPSKDSNAADDRRKTFHFVAVGEPISHPANIEIPLGRNTFLSKHSLDMRFTYADDRIEEFFGYNPNSLVKKSVYDFYHAEDSPAVMDAFKSLVSKGQAQTERYRFLALGGGYAWVLTEATIIYGNGSHQPLSIVCVNFIISEIEHKDEVYSLCQLAEEYDSSTTAVSGAASKSLAQPLENDPVKGDVADGYLFENSPQQLIEKLSITTTPNPQPLSSVAASAAAADSIVADSIAAAAYPALTRAAATTAADNHDTFFAVESRQPEPEPSSSSSSVVSPVQHSPLSTVSFRDFFGNSTSPSVDCPSSVTASSIASSSNFSPSFSSASSSPSSLSATSSVSSLPPPYPLSVDAAAASWLMSSGYDHSTLPSTFVYQLPGSKNKYDQQQRQQLSEGPYLDQVASSTAFSGTQCGPSSNELTDANVAEGQTRLENDSQQQVASGDAANADNSNLEKTKQPPAVPEIPKPSTINVFVPFTEDMKKGFLAFTSDDSELTMLKEEPEDLTHLAPTPGDVCVPLDESPPDYVLPDMLEEIMLSDCSLLPSDANSRVSPQPPSTTTSSSPDSFFSCKDELEPSSRPHSPILTQNDNCGLPSFGQDDDSPMHTNSVNDFLDFSLMNTADEMDDLSGKSVLMPLTLGHHDPLFPLVTNDFMWGSSSDDSCAWSSVSNSPASSLSPASSSPSLSPPLSSSSLSPRVDRSSSSLAKLLTADSVCNYDDGGQGAGARAANSRIVSGKKSTNLQTNRCYANRGGGGISGGSHEDDRRRQRGVNMAAAPANRWSNHRSQSTNLFAKSRSEANYYADGRKYRLNHNNNSLQNGVDDAKESNFRLDDRRKKQQLQQLQQQQRFGSGMNGAADDAVVVGCKRSLVENGGSSNGAGTAGAGTNGGSLCKRSKQTANSRSSGGLHHHTSAASSLHGASRVAHDDGGGGGSGRGGSGGGGGGNSSGGDRKVRGAAAAAGSGNCGGSRGANSNLKSAAPTAEEVASQQATNSVLMNLLVSGCDLSAGYNEDEYRDFAVEPMDFELSKKKIVGLLEPDSASIPSLMDLTEQDYAVNAPSAGELLQGSELLKALECRPILNLQ